MAIPNTGAFASGLYGPNVGRTELDREAWAAGIMKQAFMPNADNLIRLARPLMAGQAGFDGDTGLPITIMPRFSPQMGTKLTFAVRDVRIAQANYNSQARRETLGTQFQWGSGTIEIFYCDDGAVHVGSGDMQHDNLSRKDAAQALLQEWHHNFIDEILRIPLYGRRGIGGGFYAFPETETGAGSSAVQPSDVQEFWRGENVLPGYADGTQIFAGDANDSEDDLSGAVYIRAKDISRLQRFLGTISTARNEFPFPKINLNSQMAQSVGVSGQKIDYILMMGGEQAETLKEDTGAGFTFMQFHQQLAASSMPKAAIFWSNMEGNIGNIGIVVESRKWPVHNNDSGTGEPVSRAVVMGADCVRMAYGANKWETIGAANRMQVSIGRNLSVLGKMWEAIKSPVNEGAAEKYYCRCYLGTKRNRLHHPKTNELLDYSWAALVSNVKSVRPDSEF